MRFVVDGMNVIGSRPDGWWKDREAAMARLVEQLEHWAAATGVEATVVFERAPSTPVQVRHVEVAHAPRARRDAADEEILSRVRADPRAETITVVTSDRRLQELVAAVGAVVEPAGAFRARLDAEGPAR